MTTDSTVKDIKVTYHGGENFTYDPTLGTNPQDGDPIVAELPGNHAGDAEYLLIFTLEGATWPPGDGWIDFRHGGPPPAGALQAPSPLLSSQRSISIKNDLGEAQPQQVYGFSVIVVAPNGQTVTSPDPDIVLPPPSGQISAEVRSLE